MNWFLHPCRRHRKCLCLMAGGVLAKSERVETEKHLAECQACRSYYEEIRSAIAPLTGWEKHFAHIELEAAVQLRLRKTISSAGSPESVRTFKPEIILRHCWQQLVWPSRGIWAGLTAVWILLLAVNISLRDRSPTGAAASAPSEILLSLQQQERVLAELMGPDELRAATPQKTFSPRPSSERRFGIFMT